MSLTNTVTQEPTTDATAQHAPATLAANAVQAKPAIVGTVVTTEPPVKEGFLLHWWHNFTNMFGHAPTYIHTAQTVIKFVAPLAMLAMATFAPEVMPVAAPIIAEVQSDLATASTLVAGQTPDGLADVLQRVAINMDALLQAGHIKDDKLQTKVKTGVAEIQALISIIPTA